MYVYSPALLLPLPDKTETDILIIFLFFRRRFSYPAKIQEHLHRTLTYLPTDIVLALSDSPALISEAIAAFYEREPASLRVSLFSSLLPLFPTNFSSVVGM